MVGGRFLQEKTACGMILSSPESENRLKCMQDKAGSSIAAPAFLIFWQLHKMQKRK